MTLNTSGFKQLNYLVVFVIAVVIYSNTLWNNYAIDDAIVLTENHFTKQGFGGIKDLMTHDAFVGFFGQRGSSLIQGGRYRPLSLVTFAIEYQFWGLHAGYSHAVNVLLFALLGLLVLYLLQLIQGAPSNDAFYLQWPFIATLLFIVHPIHTEAVANIKGRDELLAMLFSVGALIFALRYVTTHRLADIGLGVVAFFLALLSKENAITFLGIVPLCYYFFFKPVAKDYMIAVGSFLVAGVIFLLIRGHYAPTGILQESSEVLNNPFALATTEQRYATIVATFILYLRLLVYPFRLTHDYYYNEIPYVTFSSGLTILSVVITLAIIAYALVLLRKKHVAAFGILFYFITFSIVSNLVFTVGILMNERFLFMPSLGFCIAIGYGAYALYKNNYVSRDVFTIGVTVVCLILASKSFSRNFAWKDNFTLLKTDVKTSTNSSKAHTTYGGLLIEEADKTKDSVLVKSLLQESMRELQMALTIYPKNGDAWLLLGNATYKFNHDVSAAIGDYTNAFQCKGASGFDAIYNIGVLQLDNKMPLLAARNLKKANDLRPGQFKCIYNLGDAYAKSNLPDSAIAWFQVAKSLEPSNAITYHAIGITYCRSLNNLEQGIPYLQQAADMQPRNMDFLDDLAVANGIKGNFNGAIETAKRMLALDSNSVAAYSILITSYANAGNKASAAAYSRKVQAITSYGARNRSAR